MICTHTHIYIYTQYYRAPIDMNLLRGLTYMLRSNWTCLPVCFAPPHRGELLYFADSAGEVRQLPSWLIPQHRLTDWLTDSWLTDSLTHLNDLTTWLPDYSTSKNKYVVALSWFHACCSSSKLTYIQYVHQLHQTNLPEIDTHARTCSMHK